MEQIVKDFLDYVSYDTQSQDESDEFPSTAKQKVLAEHLAEQLRGMGLNGRMDDYGYVYADIPANCEGAPAVGFIAHMDTATELSGANVKPRIVHYEGGDIVLNEEKNIVMRAAEFESLAQQVGKDLIVTDGTTLLGADDKAGVAEIMAMARYFVENPDVPHGTICISASPRTRRSAAARTHFDVPGLRRGLCLYRRRRRARRARTMKTSTPARPRLAVRGVSDPSRLGQGQDEERLRASRCSLHPMLPVGRDARAVRRATRASPT